MSTRHLACVAVWIALASSAVAVKAPEEAMRVEVSADGSVKTDKAARQIRSTHSSNHSWEGKHAEKSPDPAERAAQTVHGLFTLPEQRAADCLRLLSLLVPVAVATYLCHKWNDNLAKAGLVPKCGCRSMICFICCTPFAIFCPVDASSEREA
mmetsp:Transcript_13224/g.30094  ORF Transcript_13224/g.30094 Transcript_13224/m.30094 type:complete len:153 (-) Transcript_13224:26-484(-)